MSNQGQSACSVNNLDKIGQPGDGFAHREKLLAMGRTAGSVNGAKVFRSRSSAQPFLRHSAPIKLDGAKLTESIFQSPCLQSTKHFKLQKTCLSQNLCVMLQFCGIIFLMISGQ